MSPRVTGVLSQHPAVVFDFLSTPACLLACTLTSSGCKGLYTVSHTLHSRMPTLLPPMARLSVVWTVFCFFFLLGGGGSILVFFLGGAGGPSSYLALWRARRRFVFCLWLLNSTEGVSVVVVVVLLFLGSFSFPGDGDEVVGNSGGEEGVARRATSGRPVTEVVVSSFLYNRFGLWVVGALAGFLLAAPGSRGSVVVVDALSIHPKGKDL